MWLEEDLQHKSRKLKYVPTFPFSREIELPVMERFNRALDWMWNLRGGVALAFWLWLKFRLEIVHSPENTNLTDARRLAVRKTTQILQDIIARVNRAPTNVYIRGRR
jgi:hypothetical protein